MEATLKKKEIHRLIRYSEIGALIGFLGVFVVFSVISKNFLTPSNFASIFTISAELGIVTIGITFLMIAGEFDLSVGSVFAIVPMFVILFSSHGIPVVIAFLLSMLVAAGIGYLNGVITLRAGIPSFITTLGMQMFWRGILLAVTGGFPLYYKGSLAFLGIFGKELAGDIRASGIWFILITIVFSIILTNTRYGNWVFATGGNPRVAKALGVSANRVKMINFILCALLAGFAGMANLSRFKIVDPTLGMGMELEAIAAAVIGGTFLNGGYGSVIGAFIGAFLIGMVQNGLILAGAPPYWYRAFIGIILVIAAIINMKIKRAVAG
ncbi:MAG: ABC transporter permease [Synergistetes bacterium]|nr:ABC transporter permease [Synergistota bacterium]